ncbi:Os09g0377600 [Oryza sativa Japonica Group]|uniref:Uncharacterized protein n=3 Tax=Oryza sativa subsp. japonica TaxID=39947 RepID=Q6H5E4_ORYSJ|nr:hypothetical protein [Oryza sativa Japonica Group]BAD26294.1 hypothetical protein [Oryza sativa Japonica Group]BAT07823.1 Os09g0377600 [Oryza sativa Japonica Group]
MATNSATAARKMAVVICTLALILAQQQLMAVDASPAEQHGRRLLGDCWVWDCPSAEADGCCTMSGCTSTCVDGVTACVCG